MDFSAALSVFFLPEEPEELEDEELLFWLSVVLGVVSEPLVLEEGVVFGVLVEALGIDFGTPPLFPVPVFFFALGLMLSYCVYAFKLRSPSFVIICTLRSVCL